MKRLATPALLAVGLTAACVLAYLRVLSAGFVGLDDEIHVYANPLLNPPTLQGVASFWHAAYKGLYVPLAYTIFSLIARFAGAPPHLDRAIGDTVSLDPVPFHFVSVALHLANACVCYLLVWRLTRRRPVALLASLVFALHPLQVESVAWISELRGLGSGFFALLALYALVRSRQATSVASTRTLLATSVVSLTCAMLCKPSAAALPVVAMAIDRVALETPWRKTLTAAALWAACAAPFALLTRSLQSHSTSAPSLWWQRPFIAGDALTFYLRKALAPFDLCVDYGRIPSLVMSQAWGNVAWVVPVALLVVCYRLRQRRPLTWLGALLFVGLLLPTLGFVPFTYQSYSTVADRYTYLPLLGVGLLVGDAVDCLGPRRKIALATVALVVLACLSFNQTRYWANNADFLQHTLAVNPAADFVYLNRGRTEQANHDFTAALTDYQTYLRRQPTLLRAYVNLAEVHFQLDQPAEGARIIAESQTRPGLTAEGMSTDDFGNLGMLLMQANQAERAVDAFSTAVTLNPKSSEYLYDHANALVAVGRLDQAESAFRRCISLEPDLAGAHTGLGILLAESHRVAEAVEELRAALRLQPDDAGAQDNLRRAEEQLAHPQP